MTAPAPAQRAAWLADHLGLQPHPEGGRYREIHRAAATVVPDDGRPARPALTAIYFLLAEGECSGWHQVLSDETWHYHEGAPLELVVANPVFEMVATWRLGTFDPAAAVEPVRVVPAGWWQAARPTGDYTLVSCDVGPGFDFADFTMLRDRPQMADLLRTRHPSFLPFL